jgi:NitT/TauT family transport system substrate-binding protein
VDTAISIEPYTTLSALQSGARTVFDLYGSGPTAQLPLACFFATDQFVKQNPKTMTAFAKAVAKGAADAQDRATVEKILPSFTKVDSNTAHLIALPGYPGSLNAKDFQRVADLMKTYGLLGNPLNVSPMILPTPSAGS